jgi:hypothetical protein
VTELKQIVDQHREPIRKFAARIQALAPGNALGWTIYDALGPTEGNAAPRAVHSVLVLQTMDLSLLRHLGAVGRHYGPQGLVAPLVITPDFLDSSRDTFPLELIEIEQAHSTIFGPDYFAGLEFDGRDVRLQCERELEILLIGLQQGLVAFGGIEDRLRLLKHDWLRALLRALCGLLWLKGQKKRLPAEQIVAEVAKLLDLPLTGIRRALAASTSPGWQAFEQLHADVKAVGIAADGW